MTSYDITHMNDFHMSVYKPLFMKVTRQAQDMEEEGRLHVSILKINIYFCSPEDRSKAYEELKQYPLTFVYAEKTSLEIKAENVTKATGLIQLGKFLGISLNEIVGIGDANNDIEMLSTVGFSVAMNNAHDDIKKLCKFITKDNDHNGVGEAIQYIMSNKYDLMS